MHRRPRTAAVLAVLALLLSGCSMPQLVWTYVDRLAVSQIDEWLDLDAEQRDRVGTDVRVWLDTIRGDMMPRYATLLYEFADSADDGLDYAEARAAADRAVDLYGETVRLAIPWLARILADLDAQQQQHLAERLIRSNRIYQDDYLLATPAERGEALGERFVGHVERWTGDLPASQRDVIRAHAGDLPDTAETWYRYRVRMQAGLFDLLVANAEPAEIAAHLDCWWVTRCGRRLDEDAATEELFIGLVEMVARLDEWLTPAQQSEALSSLRSRADDLANLARD